MYHQLEDQIPESIHAQTFFVSNFLEFKLDHENILISKGEKNRYYFQLIQPSLVPGAQLMEPYYLDKGGKPFTTWVEPQAPNLENVVIGEPIILEGEQDEEKK